jgi:hypothetical protein
VESVGDTERVPRAATVPIAGLIVTSVASLTVHRSVEDCPRSMVEGSAVNCTVGAFGGGGASVCAGGGGGGGGGGAAFFLQPAANRNIDNAKSAMLILLLFILYLAS